ncbi:MAG: xanthine dehydrogenase family protein molybdopterin-binding subunit [Anaerolineaceae bacterium]
MPAEPAAVGRPSPRKDALDRVTGRALYTADICLPDLLHGAVLRSPHHHALIKSIDTSRAANMPGVAAVLTSRDVPAARTFGGLVADQPVLAFDKVRHFGEPIALVVAGTIDQARAACRTVAVEYEELPAILDVREALRTGAPAVHHDGNLCTDFHITHGDPAEGFAEADIILEETFTLQRLSPAYMEPETSLASMQPDGTLEVWTGSQKPFIDRAAIASVLGIDPEKVIVRSAEVGGAFGGKEDSMLAVLASLAAFKVKGSVLLANERRESFVAHPKRHPAVIHLKIGAKKNGALTALSSTTLMDTGAYASYGPAVASQFTEMSAGAYHVQNVEIETSLCYTNTPLCGAMRGFGNPQAAFAIESMMNILAEKLGLDPLDLRERNMLNPGDEMPTGLPAGPWADSLPGVLKQARLSYEKLKARPPAHRSGGCQPKTGVGLALVIQPMGLGRLIPDRSTHTAEWLPDGTVRLGLGAPEIGQGLATVSEQMLAEALGIPSGQVFAGQLDTSLVPDGGVTCASRMTYLVGNALHDAAANLKMELITRAAELMAVDPASLRYEAGNVIDARGLAVPAAEIAARLAEQNQILKVTGSADFPEPANYTRQDLPIGMPHGLFVFGAQVARVEVDPELGKVSVTDLIAIHDPGRVINPSTAAGQVQGGVAMGLGYALLENMPLKTNGVWVDTFAEYLLPTVLDLPASLEVVFLETPEESSAFGAKGLGEVVTAPTAPAIADAVFRAVGKRVTRLPISAEDLLDG